MPRLNWIVVLAIAGCGEPAAPAQTPEPLAIAPPVVDTTARIARGEYVATIAGCVVCHTPMDASGSRPDRSRLSPTP